MLEGLQVYHFSLIPWLVYRMCIDRLVPEASTLCLHMCIHVCVYACMLASTYFPDAALAVGGSNDLAQTAQFTPGEQGMKERKKTMETTVLLRDRV